MPSMHDHHDMIMTMFMDSSSSSLPSSSSTTSSSMHAKVVTGHNYEIDHLSLIDTCFDISIQAGLYSNSSIPTFLEPVGLGNQIYGDYGTVDQSGTIMGLDREFSLPPLESSKCIIGDAATNYTTIDVKTNNEQLNDIIENIKFEDMFGFGNHWQGENLRMGEWDFEGCLHDNVSSFPFLS